MCLLSRRFLKPDKPSRALRRYVFEPAAADKAATLKAVKEMRGR